MALLAPSCPLQQQLLHNGPAWAKLSPAAAAGRPRQRHELQADASCALPGKDLGALTSDCVQNQHLSGFRCPDIRLCGNQKLERFQVPSHQTGWESELERLDARRPPSDVCSPHGCSGGGQRAAACRSGTGRGCRSLRRCCCWCLGSLQQLWGSSHGGRQAGWEAITTGRCCRLCRLRGQQRPPRESAA